MLFFVKSKMIIKRSDKNWENDSVLKRTVGIFTCIKKETKICGLLFQTGP